MRDVVYEPHDSSLIDRYRYGLAYRADWPNPIVIDIPQTSADSLFILCYDDETLQDSLIFHVSAANHTTELYNLIPNRIYRYEITCGDDVLQQGKIHTFGQLRQIKVCNTVYNVRDLGGWRTADNMQLRYGKLFRGTELNGTYVATTEGIDMLRGLGIGAELDLRAPYNEGHGVSAFGFSIISSSSGVARYYYSSDSGQLPSHLKEYIWRNKWKREFQFIVGNLRLGRAVYEHCVHGKDRTGFLSFLLEGLLGVTYNDLVKDYELTFFSNQTESTKDSIDKVFDYIETMYGETLRDKFNTYFVNYLGVNQDDIDYFRSEMLEAVKPRENDSTVRDIETNNDGNNDRLFYDLNGRRVISPISGRLYLIRGRNGYTYKIFYQ